MSRRKRFSRRLKQIFAKTGGRCAYCGCELELETFHVDHVLPIAFGGSDAIENLVPACVYCNTSKRALTLEEFRDHVLGVIAKRLQADALPRLQRYEMVLCDKDMQPLVNLIALTIRYIHAMRPVFYFERNDDQRRP